MSQFEIGRVLGLRWRDARRLLEGMGLRTFSTGKRRWYVRAEDWGSALAKLMGMR